MQPRFSVAYFAPTVPGKHGIPKTTASAHGSATKTESVDTQSFRQMLVTSSGTVIAVAYTGGTFKSTNRRRDMARYVADEWIVGPENGPRGFPPVYIAHRVRSMTEFDGYLWAATSTGWILRAPSDGPTSGILSCGLTHSRLR